MIAAMPMAHLATSLAYGMTRRSLATAVQADRPHGGEAAMVVMAFDDEGGWVFTDFVSAARADQREADDALGARIG